MDNTRLFFSSQHREARVHNSILPDMLSAVGHTPMVRLDKIAKAAGLECELGK